jgi:LmbE family N-acetylglucosaminyl deacetylase
LRLFKAENNPLFMLNSWLGKWKEQIPRGLKPARNEKCNELGGTTEVVPSRLAAPFCLARGLRVFQQTVKRASNEKSKGLASVRKSLGQTRGFLLCVLLLVGAAAQTSSDKASPVDPLPQDSGTAGLKDMLQRLHTTARLLHTTAHPDDEDGGLLTLESRGEGVTATLLTMNRGEGGQNKVGSNLFDVLGVVRTLELTQSDRYYGVNQRFTRVADFGFSKSPDETFQKWQGHDVALADIVRVIRTFRPDVLVSRFGGTERDGHGNHQASGILSREAFRAAADPNRFPEQIKEGLLPWQAKKFYVDNVCPFRSNECPDGNWTIRLNTGEQNAALGMSYIQFAMQGLKHQQSQGVGNWSLDAGPHYAFYKLVDSVLPPTTDKNGHEKGFWDGIDTALVGLAARLGAEESKAPFLKPGLVQLQAKIDEATRAAEKEPSTAAEPLISGSEIVRKLIAQVKNSSLSSAAENQLLANLDEKQAQLGRAMGLAAGVSLTVRFDGPIAPRPEDAFMAVPGQNFKLKVTFAYTAPVEWKGMKIDLPPGWSAILLGSGDSAMGRARERTSEYDVKVAADAQYTRPYLHRGDPETDGVYTIDDRRYETLPFPPAPVQAHAVYSIGGKEAVVHTVGMVAFKDENGNEAKHAIAVAPPFSIRLEPATQVISTSHSGTSDITVGIRSNIATSQPASLRLELPAGWTAEPTTQPVSFHAPGETKEFKFRVKPADLRESRHEVKAVLDYQGKSYDLGYTVVTRPDLDTFYYYQPAAQRVSIVDVKVPNGLKVGYIMGAGDAIPAVLQQVGVEVTMIPPEKLASEDLSRFSTVVLGIRAYDTQKDVIANNKKLLDYAASGGTLIVQYETDVSDFNSGHLTPYPAQLSRARVSVEEAPVEILKSEDPLFHYPNRITEKDFDGWVQERGLYFMGQWDSHFQPLLSSHDPGEEAQKGGLLKAQVGKGLYMYSGYAFFRQLPAGVPGAVRLYVNMLCQSSGGGRQAAAGR